MEEAELAELPVEGVLATPAMPIHAGVEETMAAVGAALVVPAVSAAAGALLDTAAGADDATGTVVGVGKVLLGGDINALGALGGLKVGDDEDDEGEGGMRPACTLVGSSEGDRKGVDTD